MNSVRVDYFTAEKAISANICDVSHLLFSVRKLCFHYKNKNYESRLVLVKNVNKPQKIPKQDQDIDLQVGHG